MTEDETARAKENYGDSVQAYRDRTVLSGEVQLLPFGPDGHADVMTESSYFNLSEWLAAHYLGDRVEITIRRLNYPQKAEGNG